MVKLPKYLAQFFWDIDFAKLDPKIRAQYVVERILEMGNIEAVRWVFKQYTKDTIKRVVCQSRAISKKTANYWSLMLDIPKEEILCLQPDFQKTHRAIWPH